MTPAKKPARMLTALGVYTVLGFLPMGISFLLLPLYTARLSPEQYGILTEANVTHTFATLFFAAGLDAAFNRFYFDFEAESPGPLVETSDDLIDAIRDVESATAGHKERYDAFVDRFCPLDDGHAASRTVDRILTPGD